MKISSLYSLSAYVNTQAIKVPSQNQIPAYKEPGTSCDKIAFCGKFAGAKDIKDGIIKFASEQILKKYERFTPKDFKSLSVFEYGILNKASKDFYNDAYEAVVDASRLLKKDFDSRYGKDNYVFVSIGRSLESVADGMSYMGAQTRVLPISGLHRNACPPEVLISQRGFKNYQNYLSEIGLDKNSIASSPKHYIFSDYCCTGSTLDTVEKLMKSETMGLNLDNVEFADFDHMYFELFHRAKKRPKTIPELMNLHLNYGYFKYFSRTKRLNYYDLENVYKAVGCAENYDTKLFNFRLMKKFIGR